MPFFGRRSEDCRGFCVFSRHSVHRRLVTLAPVVFRSPDEGPFSLPQKYRIGVSFVTKARNPFACLRIRTVSVSVYLNACPISYTLTHSIQIHWNRRMTYPQTRIRIPSLRHKQDKLKDH